MIEEKHRDLENYLALIKAVYNNTPDPPCLNCPFYQACSSRTLACKDFAQYVKNGTLPKNSIPTKRKPTFKWYHTIFLVPRTLPEN